MATIIGNNSIIWGAGAAASLGKVQSASRKVGGEKVELKDADGDTFAVIYFDQKQECEFTAIALSDVTLPAIGDTITIGGVVNCRVDEVEEQWENAGAKKFTIRATKYAGIS